MNKIVLVILLVFHSNLFAQKFGYVNSEFILNNMKEYKEAISEIENLSKAWEKEISDMYIEIEKKEIELKTEEILLTKEMFEEDGYVLDAPAERKTVKKRRKRRKTNK